MEYETDCDMGSIKIYGKDVALFFMNNVGDVPNKVVIHKKKTKLGKHEFLGHFTVKKKNSVFLSQYDCDDLPIHTFEKGRWFVNLIGDTRFVIEKIDEDLHA